MFKQQSPFDARPEMMQDRDVIMCKGSWSKEKSCWMDLKLRRCEKELLQCQTRPTDQADIAAPHFHLMLLVESQGNQANCTGAVE